MKIKTADAIGLSLDWLVAKCEGISDWQWEHFMKDEVSECWSFSTYWNAGGPIIERKRYTLAASIVGWSCRRYNDDLEMTSMQIGETALIAAMRCHVAEELGDEVEIPEALA